MIENSYAVDTVISVVNELSNTPPVFFQSNEEFYAITPDCFGKVSLGLSLVSNGRNDELPEIIASEDIIIKEKDKSRRSRENEKTKFKKGEKKHILPLVFGVDSGVVFSLESIANIASNLGKLPDDGKIRLISHYNQYHSHKHGYAADGSDTWLSAARVMDREVYFNLIKQKEDKFFNVLVDVSKSPEGAWEKEVIRKAFPILTILPYLPP